MSSNSFDLLGENDAPKAAAKATKPAAAAKPAAPAAQPKTSEPRQKVPDREKAGGAQKGGRGGPTRRGPPREGKRQFDRRGGADSHERGQARKGAFSQGSDNTVVSHADGEEKQAEVVATEATQEETAVEPVAEPQPTGKTLQDFLAEQQARLVAAQKQVRAPEVDAKYKNAKPLERADEEKKAPAASSSSTKQTKQRKVLSIDEIVPAGKSTSSSSFSGRKDRHRPNLKSQQDFPSLG